MALTSEELNFLVYRYLQESGECAAVVMDVPERNDARQNDVFFADVMIKTGRRRRRFPPLAAPCFARQHPKVWRPSGSIAMPRGIISRALRH